MKALARALPVLLLTLAACSSKASHATGAASGTPSPGGSAVSGSAGASSAAGSPAASSAGGSSTSGSAAPGATGGASGAPGAATAPVTRPAGSPVPVATTGTVVAPPASPTVFSTAPADASCQDLVSAPYTVLQCGTVGTHTVVAEQQGDVGNDAQFRVDVLHHEATGWVLDLQRSSEAGELDKMAYLAAEVDASSGLDLVIGARASGSGQELTVDIVTGMDTASPSVVLHKDLAAGVITVDGGVRTYDAQYAAGSTSSDPSSYVEDALAPGSGARDVSDTEVGTPATAPDTQI